MIKRLKIYKNQILIGILAVFILYLRYFSSRECLFGCKEQAGDLIINSILHELGRGLIIALILYFLFDAQKDKEKKMIFDNDKKRIVWKMKMLESSSVSLNTIYKKFIKQELGSEFDGNLNQLQLLINKIQELYNESDIIQIKDDYKKLSEYFQSKNDIKNHLFSQDGYALYTIVNTLLDFNLEIREKLEKFISYYPGFDDLIFYKDNDDVSKCLTYGKLIRGLLQSYWGLKVFFDDIKNLQVKGLFGMIVLSQKNLLEQLNNGVEINNIQFKEELQQKEWFIILNPFYSQLVTHESMQRSLRFHLLLIQFSKKIIKDIEEFQT